ncbi:unnamed protein product [Heligmosomoides polygyrus]|uniref:Endo/exonuclease/phosphatase domain-containing protein n=1 Tax=Heligmosomoides polygyrus TaxID=6339 RepID=A0A183GLW8_HELPZ|nr:unnamed protein product [Heligmosomoides polygyrus]
MGGRHRSATELVRKSRNVSRTRVATLNVDTLTGRSCQLDEALERRGVDLCAVQETRWSCSKSRGIGRGLKAVLCGPMITSGVRMIISERFRDSIVSVERFNDRLMKIVVFVKERLYHFYSAYAPQSGCSDQAKEEFWSLHDEKTAEVQQKDVIIVAGDLNGHVGAVKEAYSCHGGLGYRSRDADDAKVVPMRRSPAASAVICTFKITPPRMKQVKRCGAARIKGWRMKEKEAAVISRVRLPTVTTVDETWKMATDAIRQAARLKLGTTKPERRKVDKQTWLWTDDVKAKDREKKSLYHVFLGDRKADNWREYPKAKKAAKKAVAVAGERPSSDRPQKGGKAMVFCSRPVHKITVKEAEAALQKLKPGKATEPDNLAADVWKSKLWYPAEWLAELFNQVLKDKKVPECWHISMTIPIWKKKGSPADCSNYRPIRYLSYSMKIFERFLGR